MAKTPEVHWAEGMFLRPHHLQVGERHREEMLRQEVRRLQPFFWGLLKVDIALDQLENFAFEVRDMDVKLKDATALSLASNLRLPSRSFKTELDQAGGRMEVWLGVPSWRELDANAFAAGEAAGGQDRRWNVEAVEVLDENTGGNPQVIESRRANGRFFFGRESREGYECVPIALVERAGQGKNTPVLSMEFIPSVTEIGAWPALQQLTRIPRVHPFMVYVEFCRLAGELSIFDDQKSPVKIPLYDHDDLGRCFFEITHVLEMLSEKIVASRYLRVDFMTREELLVANLSPEWLAPESEIYLHVESPLDEKEVKTKLEVMKIGTPADIPILKQRRLFGLDLAMLKRVPSGLPAREDYFYLSIEKDGPYWADVLKDRVIAIAGGIDPKLKFSLFIVTKPTKPSSGGATGTASRGPGGSRA